MSLEKMMSDRSANAPTLREYFAAQFMATAWEQAGKCPDWDLKAMFGDRTGLRREEIAAALAYRMADAMVARGVQ
jgi:hypothetical protein